MLNVGDWVLENDGSISQVIEVDLWYSDSYRLLNPSYDSDTPYWVSYTPIKLTELLKALLQLRLYSKYNIVLKALGDKQGNKNEYLRKLKLPDPVCRILR